jgi:hypothetical protein
MSDRLSADPWAALRGLCESSAERRLDILTGFLGRGFSGVLRELNIEHCRLIFGWDGKSPILSPSLLAEIASLGSALEVRWAPGLHAKVYIVPGVGVVVGSANFTASAFERLFECVLATNRRATTNDAEKIFRRLWKDARPLKGHGGARTGSQFQPGEAPSLGVGSESRRSAFLRGNSATRTGKVVARTASGPVVRLCAYVPGWLLHDDGFEKNDEIRWSTGARAKVGDLQLFCVSTNLVGAPEPEATQLRKSLAFDALHSLWRATSGAKKYRGPWPHQAKFELVVKLHRPVKKAELVRAGILPVPRWPQQPGGKILNAEQVAAVMRLLVKRNPGQAKSIRSALGRMS